MHKTAFILYTIIIITALLFSGCGRRATPVYRGIEDQALLMGNGAEPQDLDPHIVTGVTEHNIISALLEGLVTEDPKDLSARPGAAERWEVSPDGREYLFYLRSDGRWSNGDTVTAADFVFSFKRILSPGLGSEYAYMLYCIENAERYNKAEIDDFSQVGAETVNRFILKIRLSRPVPYFLSMLTHYSWFPVNPATILKFGRIDERGNRWTRTENYVGNGPFVLEKWEMNRLVSVKKSGYYWDRERVRLNEIRFYPVDNDQTEERSYRSGQLHITQTVPANRIAWYRENDPSVLRIDEYLGTYYYRINVQKPPLDDPLVRRALAMSIDREMIVKHVLKSGQIPACHFTPENTAGYTSSTCVKYDPEEARRLLAEAGYPGGEGFPHCELLYNTSEGHHTLAQAIQQMWKKELNINITLTNQEWKVYLETVTRQDYDIARAGWIGDYVDPNSFLNLWLTGGGNNNTGWSNHAYDSLINSASITADREERNRLFDAAERILLAEMPVIPIYFYTNTSLVHAAVKNWYPNLLDHHPYKYVYLE